MRSRDEPVRLTRIYTRGGDAGETSLGDGSRVSKLDCRIGAFGTVDELNSALGVVLAGDVPEAMREALELVQNELFDVGADLSVPWGVTDRLRVEHGMIERLEELCDAFNAELPELKSFILPGGTETAARLHVARTICRRAERDVLLGSQEMELNPQVLIYLNRLSDLLFILARLANAGREPESAAVCREASGARANSPAGSFVAGLRWAPVGWLRARGRVRRLVVPGSCSGRCGCRSSRSAATRSRPPGPTSRSPLQPRAPAQ